GQATVRTENGQPVVDARRGLCRVALTAWHHPKVLSISNNLSRRESYCSVPRTMSQNEAVARVILLGLDGFPNRAVDPIVTPRLWTLGQRAAPPPAAEVRALPPPPSPGSRRSPPA